ncbi:hypothetical protein AB0J31_38875 [Streptosporangium saharense]
MARQHRLDPGPITAKATVAFGHDPADGGYQLHADLVVTRPGVDHARTTFLLAQATALCPYTKMTRQGKPGTTEEPGFLDQAILTWSISVPHD